MSGALDVMEAPAAAEAPKKPARETLLCVGGPSAGARIDVPLGTVDWTVVDLIPARVEYRSVDACPPIGHFRYTLYKRFDFYFGRGMERLWWRAICVLAPHDLTHADVFAELVKGYRRDG
jgi:hypothetical protein